jgi:hypothetical protein
LLKNDLYYHGTPLQSLCGGKIGRRRNLKLGLSCASKGFKLICRTYYSLTTQIIAMLLCRIFTILSLLVLCLSFVQNFPSLDFQFKNTYYVLDFQPIASFMAGMVGIFGFFEFLLRNRKSWRWLSWLYAIPLVLLTLFICLFEVHQNLFYLYALLIFWSLSVLCSRLYFGRN